MPIPRSTLLSRFLLILFLCQSMCGLAVYATELSASDAADLYEATNTYTIIRKGKKIGTHTLSFSSANTRLKVNAKSAIKVTALKIPVFRFNYESTEVWESDRLVSVDSTAKTGKKIEQSTLRNNENVSQLSNGTDLTDVARIAYATNHWNIMAVKQSILFNTIKGVASNIEVKNHGDTVLNIGNTTINATHYEYTGDIKAQSWYDENNRWVKLLFLGSDGSEISYTIDTP